MDTAKYHYLVWKKLADELNIPFTEKDNERFKGVSRARCMEILMELGNLSATEKEKDSHCEKKNNIYVQYVRNMSEDEILPGVVTFLSDAKARGYHTALGSASKNTDLILEKLHLKKYFDVVIDGTKVTRAKPDPAVFLQGAAALGVAPHECIVFEDAAAGIQAAHAGGMIAVGIGTSEDLPEAEVILSGFEDVNIADVETMLVQSMIQ